MAKNKIPRHQRVCHSGVGQHVFCVCQGVAETRPEPLSWPGQTDRQTDYLPLYPPTHPTPGPDTLHLTAHYYTPGIHPPPVTLPCLTRDTRDLTYAAMSSEKEGTGGGRTMNVDQGMGKGRGRERKRKEWKDGAKLRKDGM